jgi:hypothetical protein
MQQISRTTAPIAMTEWFPATNDPAIIGRVVHVKRINVPESKKRREEVYITYPAIEHKTAGIQGDISFALIKEEADPDNADYWKRRFAKAWAAYKGSENSVPDGTPLADFDEIPEHKAAEFKLHGLTTVEQLAIMSDANCDSIGTGAKKWRSAAQRFLKKRANHGYGYSTQG